MKEKACQIVLRELKYSKRSEMWKVSLFFSKVFLRTTVLVNNNSRPEEL